MSMRAFSPSPWPAPRRCRSPPSRPDLPRNAINLLPPRHGAMLTARGERKGVSRACLDRRVALFCPSPHRAGEHRSMPGSITWTRTLVSSTPLWCRRPAERMTCQVELVAGPAGGRRGKPPGYDPSICGCCWRVAPPGLFAPSLCGRSTWIGCGIGRQWAAFGRFSSVAAVQRFSNPGMATKRTSLLAALSIAFRRFRHSRAVDLAHRRGRRPPTSRGQDEPGYRNWTGLVGHSHCRTISNAFYQWGVAGIVPTWQLRAPPRHGIAAGAQLRSPALSANGRMLVPDSCDYVRDYVIPAGRAVEPVSAYRTRFY